MNTNYWVKKEVYKEVLTKTQIPNKGNFSLMAYHFNTMDKKGVGFYFDKSIEFKNDFVFRKNGYEYVVLDHKIFKEFLILPNNNLPEYVDNVASKIDNCKTETEVLSLLIAEM
ncbi:MAG: hypothetical protein LC107_03110 [Chitinophagales bacterium]|nr:hypothetical protein [Chitinophagales bacterium]